MAVVSRKTFTCHLFFTFINCKEFLFMPYLDHLPFKKNQAWKHWRGIDTIRSDANANADGISLPDKFRSMFLSESMTIYESTEVLDYLCPL